MMVATSISTKQHIFESFFLIHSSLFLFTVVKNFNWPFVLSCGLDQRTDLWSLLDLCHDLFFLLFVPFCVSR